MSLLTNWGYTLTDISALDEIITAEEFNKFTADKYSGDARIASNISAVSQAIRNYCGWHVYPSATCELSTTFFDSRITPVRGALIIQLPAKYVSEVSSITIDGAEYTTFVAEPNGIVKVYNVDCSGLYEYSPIVVNYTAGLPYSLSFAIKELAAHRITHAMASNNGVQSETAGGVSITYSANWINSARSTALADDNKEVLAPYRIQGVF